MKLRQALVLLFWSPGWVELPEADREQIQPYVEERQVVNEIDEHMTLYRLNDQGKRRAREILLKRGYDVTDGCGVSQQTRRWTNTEQYTGAFASLVDAISELRSIVEPPVYLHDHPCGKLVQLSDVSQINLEFSKHVGWERHQTFDEPLRHDISPAMRWLWTEHLMDIDGTYQELILWNTSHYTRSKTS